MATLSENALNCVHGPPTKNTDEIKDNRFVNMGTKYQDIDFSNYAINVFGQVKNKQGMLMQPYIKDREYYSYRLTDGTAKLIYTVRMHRLVASVFLDNPNNAPIVHHIDENKINNHVSNLEWTDCKTNITYSIGKKIGQYSLDDELIQVFNSMCDGARHLGKTNHSKISLACSGGRKTAYGFKWKLV